MLIDDKLNNLAKLNKSLKPPRELPGVFLPKDSKEQFDFMFIAEMPSMNAPKDWDGKTNYNFDVTARDKFLQEIMAKYGVAGSYVTDIVKEQDKPRRPTEEEIKKWLSFLRKEIKIIEPKVIVVLGKTTYEKSFKPFIEPDISDISKEIKKIKVNWVFHYSSQVPRDKFERRFGEIINKMRNSE